MPDLVSGRIPIMIDGLEKLHHAGKIRFLALTGRRRPPRRRLSGGPVAARQQSKNGGHQQKRTSSA